MTKTIDDWASYAYQAATKQRRKRLYRAREQAEMDLTWKTQPSVTQQALNNSQALTKQIENSDLKYQDAIKAEDAIKSAMDRAWNPKNAMEHAWQNPQAPVHQAEPKASNAAFERDIAHETAQQKLLAEQARELEKASGLDLSTIDED